MRPYAGPYFELKAYLTFVCGLLSVVALQLVMASIHQWAWLGGMPAEVAIFTGVPTLGGAPASVHAANLMLWSVPGIVTMRWILGFTYGRSLAWTGVILGYFMSCGLVFVFSELAQVSPVPVLWWELAGIGLCLTVGYWFTRTVVLRDSRELSLFADLDRSSG